ncbi:MAG: dUTP diphosphatase [Clostridia bacterium]|nr:dUTP diphosphatase [Clostridia bacterium]
MMLKINAVKLREDARLPSRATDGSAGADLYAACDEHITEIGPHETVLVHTGLAFEIPDGYVGLVFARSSLGTKRGLAPANKVGVIDSDYRGEVMVSLHNHTDITQKIENGERVAQLVIVPYLKAEYVETDSLGETDRGSGGFGSTGTK